MPDRSLPHSRGTVQHLSLAYQGINAPQHLSLQHLLKAHAQHIPDAAAILAPGRTGLTYGRLHDQVDSIAQMLRVMGLGRDDRIAVMLPNGPELAVALLAVASTATCAPLNSAYGHELEAYFAELRVTALLIQADLDSPARAAAKARGIRLLELSPIPDAEAGMFTLRGESQTPPRLEAFSQAEDVALLLLTSGTMARPKTVPLTHANICTSAFNTALTLALTEGDRCLNIMPLFHPHGLIGALLASLMAGASIVCTPGLQMPHFFAWMAEFRPTWYTAVPTIHQAVLAHAAAHREIIAAYPLRFIRSGSASLLPQVLTELEQVFDAPVVEYYGMTESSSQITSNPLPPGIRKLCSVGIATGPEVAIMDEAGNRLPAGEEGEIVIRGETIFHAYENNDETNRDAFVENWFRTGDLGYLDRDGYLFITGRMKEVINRGGTKVAPREVEEVLLQHPAVAHAATFAVPHTRWGEDVVTAAVLRRETTATEAELRHFVASHLAAFKVPSQVLIVDAIPLGPTGKLQRRDLAEQFGLTGSEEDRAAVHTPYAAPRTPLEAALTGIWAMVLGVERVGIHDSFFRLGGDSLLATQLLLRMHEVTHVEVTLHSLFETPTIAGLAAHMTATRQLRPQGPELSLQSSARHGPLVLSYAQQRLWLLEQLGISQHAYHLIEALRLRGNLRIEALAQSLQAIAERHEVLRTVFTHVAGQPHQVIRQAMHVPVAEIGLSALPQKEQEVRVQQLAQDEVRRPFDLGQGPLLRAVLVRLGDQEHILLLTMHHLVSDGWSQGVFWRELAARYGAYTAGQPSPLLPLCIQYGDFANWQQQWMQGEALDRPLAYWRSQLAGVSPLQLPTDHPRPAVPTSQGARHRLIFSPTLSHGLKTLSQQHGVTLFMTLLAALQTLLYRYTGQDDIAVGTLIANRHRIELEELIGFFVNTLVLRTDLSGDPSVRALLDRVRVVTLSAIEHQEVPYEKLLEAVRPPRDLSRNPLFQVLCVFHNMPQQAPALPGLTVESLEIDPGAARFDLTVEFWDTPEGLRCRFEYSTDLFEATTIARMGGHLQALLESFVSDPELRLSRLPLLTAEERHRLLVEWNATALPYPTDQCLHHVFEARVGDAPDAVAVICGDDALSYRELNRRANQIAHDLLAMGVQPNTPVGLCIDRSLTMVAGLLGILKAGAAYLPLDPGYPQERLDFILRDAQPPVVLTQERLLASLPVVQGQLVCLDVERSRLAQNRDDNPATRVSAENAAYLLYTSGSTGNPKGVVGLHRATLNALSWMWQTFPFGENEVCCQKTSISFGDSIQEWLGPLLGGKPLVLIPDAILRDLPRFVQTLALHRVTRIILVPSLLRTLLEAYPDLSSKLSSLDLWFAGGETLPGDLVRRFQECLPNRRLINLYGASEASDDTMWYDTQLMPHTQSQVPIGRPIANTDLYVLDPNLEPVPIGVTGELYVGGDGLTQGYFNRPQLTAERFIPHPYKAGRRLYRTGDLVRYQVDGTIEYIGRGDQQVKLRGVLVAIEEIEAALRQHPAVRDTAVTTRDETPGEPSLVAYIVPTHAREPTIRELRRFLEQKLPMTMVPSVFVILDRLPQTPSGKLDRRGLPPPSAQRPALGDLFVAPQTVIEQQIAAIWCDLLRVEQVGLHDSFFELGGHSLLAMKLLFRVAQATHVDVPLARFFMTPTVAHLATAVESVDRTGPGKQVSPILPVPRDDALPASITQEHFWLFEQLLPGLPLAHLSCLVRLQGELDVSLLERCFHEMITRHEALRTTFAVRDEQLVQLIAPALYMPLAVRDLHELPEAEREPEARRIAREEIEQPFDLSCGPLLRVCLLKLGARDHFLMIALHHIIGDGWSLEVLVRELAVLYEASSANAPAPLPALPIQYADVAAWQRQWQNHPQLSGQLDYWRDQLREPLPALTLPTDRPRGTALHLRTASQTFEIPAELLQALRERSRQEGCTLFMTCLAAFNILLYGYTGQEDLCVATLVANRTRTETENLIGLFVNTVILRTDLSGNPTGREVLQRVRATTEAAYAHQALPFEELVRTLERERHLDRASFCRVMVIWQDFLIRQPSCPCQSLNFQMVEQGIITPEVAVTTFDIILMLNESPHGMTGTCLYKTDLYEATMIRRMLGDFQFVLTCLSVHPEQVLTAFILLPIKTWGFGTE